VLEKQGPLLTTWLVSLFASAVDDDDSDN